MSGIGEGICEVAVIDIYANYHRIFADKEEKLTLFRYQ